MKKNLKKIAAIIGVVLFILTIAVAYRVQELKKMTELTPEEYYQEIVDKRK